MGNDSLLRVGTLRGKTGVSCLDFYHPFQYLHRHLSPILIVDVTNKLRIDRVSAPVGKLSSGTTVKHTQVYDTTHAKTVSAWNSKGKRKLQGIALRLSKREGW